MNNLGCSGTQYRLKHCSYSEGLDSHSQDWSITCNNGIYAQFNVIMVLFLCVKLHCLQYTIIIIWSGKLNYCSCLQCKYP